VVADETRDGAVEYLRLADRIIFVCAVNRRKSKFGENNSRVDILKVANN